MASTAAKEYIYYRHLPDAGNISVTEYPLGAFTIALMDISTDDIISMGNIVSDLIDKIRNDGSLYTLQSVRHFLTSSLPKPVAKEEIHCIAATPNPAEVVWAVLTKLVTGYLMQSLYGNYCDVLYSAREKTRIIARHCSDRVDCVDGKEFVRVYDFPVHDTVSFRTHINNSPRDKEIYSSLQLYQCFRRWVEILKDGKSLFYMDMESALGDICGTAIAHLEEIHRQIMLCIKIKEVLMPILDNLSPRDPDASWILNGCANNTRIPYASNSLCFAFAVSRTSKNFYSDLSFGLEVKNFPVEMVCCANVLGLVSEEISIIMKNPSKSVKRCELCGGYFVAHSKKARFCHRPNPQHGNCPCVRVGRQKKYRERLGEDDVIKLYTKSKNSYSAWIRKNRRRNWSSETMAEIQDVYTKWSVTAERAIEMYKIEHTTESKDNAMTCCALPTVAQRSISLEREKGNIIKYQE